LQATDLGVIRWSPSQLRYDRLSPKLLRRDRVQRELFQDRFLLRGGGHIEPLVECPAKFLLQISVKFAWVLAGFRRHFAGKKIHQDAVLVRGPDGAVFSQKGCARTFFAAKAAGALKKCIHEPLETHRDLDQPPAKRRPPGRSWMSRPRFFQ